MIYYFKNELHRNVCVLKYDEKKYMVSFQTNWTQHWYYLNNEKKLDKMKYISNAEMFETEEGAYTYMTLTFHGLEYQGIEKI